MNSWDIPEGGTANKTFECNKLSNVNLTKGDEGFTVPQSTNAVTVKSYISAQLDETDDQGQKTAVSGITMAIQYLGEQNLNGTTKVLDSFNSFEFHNKAEKSSASIADGKLSVNVGGTTNYTMGTIRLVIVEIDANLNVVSYGQGQCSRPMDYSINFLNN